jgi:hypothetical protein
MTPERMTMLRPTTSVSLFLRWIVFMSALLCFKCLVLMDVSVEGDASTSLWLLADRPAFISFLLESFFLDAYVVVSLHGNARRPCY